MLVNSSGAINRQTTWAGTAHKSDILHGKTNTRNETFQ